MSWGVGATRLAAKIDRAAAALRAGVVSVTVTEPPVFRFGIQRWTATVVLREIPEGD
jgi:dihydrodipicolinate synthase/N-acetylneuraminate lyase